MILDYLASKSISSEDLVVVSPDVGGVARARAFAKKLSDAPLAIVDKRRHGHNVAEVIYPFSLKIRVCSTTPVASPQVHMGYILSFQVMNLIGDVRGKVAVMVDDMIDTAG